MAEVKKYYGKQYWRLFGGLLLVLIGCALLLLTPFYESFGIWYAFTAIIIGLLMLGGGGFMIILGFIIFLAGTSILLHLTGLIDTPYLRNAIGWVFVIIGTLMVVKASMEIIKKYRSNEPDDDYHSGADVDY